MELRHIARPAKRLRLGRSFRQSIGKEDSEISTQDLRFWLLVAFLPMGSISQFMRL
jgi:hypothetical protein